MLSDVELLDAYSRAVISVVDSVGPAVVGVSGVGTGMLITPDGYALTNSHVVSAVKAYELTLRDGSSLKAELVGKDPHTDLAVLRASGAGLPTPASAIRAGCRSGSWWWRSGIPSV